MCAPFSFNRYVRVDDDRGDELSPSAGEQPTSSQADSSTTYETTNAATSYVAERSASGGSAASLPPSRAAADGSGDQPVGGDSDSRSGGGDYNDSSSGNGGGGSVSGEKGRSGGSSSSSSSSSSGAAAAAAAARVLLDDNFMEFTEGRPLPLHDRAKEYFNRAVSIRARTRVALLSSLLFGTRRVTFSWLAMRHASFSSCVRTYIESSRDHPVLPFDFFYFCVSVGLERHPFLVDHQRRGLLDFGGDGRTTQRAGCGHHRLHAAVSGTTGFALKCAHRRLLK